MSQHANISPSSNESGKLYYLPSATQNRQLKSWQADKEVGSTPISEEPFSRFLSRVTTLPNNSEMQSVSKDLLDARLEAIEARMDARVAGMSAKLDTALAEIRADREANNIRFAAAFKDIGDIKSDILEVKSSFKTVIGNVWGAALATITVVGATLAIAISSFDSGRETSKNIAEATVRMEKLQAQLEAHAKAAANTSTPAPAAPPLQ